MFGQVIINTREILHREIIIETNEKMPLDTIWKIFLYLEKLLMICEGRFLELVNIKFFSDLGDNEERVV